jgi:hypothetical protein
MAEVQVMGDRKTPHAGCTDHSKIVYDAEIADLRCCEKLSLMLYCMHLRKDRTYLLVRQNSIESNFSVGCCCGPCEQDFDFPNIMYFDNGVFKRATFPQSCCVFGLPSVVVSKTGCMCCCMPCETDKLAVISPFDQTCCCPNVSEKRCMGFCGPLPNVPLISFPLKPQPANVDAFVEICKKTIDAAPRDGKSSAYVKPQ